MVGLSNSKPSARARVAVGLVLGLVVASLWAVSAAAGEPEAVPRSRAYVTNQSAGGEPEYGFFIGGPDDALVTGDWTGDGVSGFASRRANVFTLVDHSGTYGATASYGKATDRVFIGDWDGDGVDTFGVRRANVFFLRNQPNSGVADVVFAFGRQADEVFVGDFDGDGIDTFAVRRANQFFVRSSPTTGVADTTFYYGTASDEVVVGDWNGDHVDTFAVRRGPQVFVRNDFVTGDAEWISSFGAESDQLLVGDFDGDHVDTFAVRRTELVAPGTFATIGPVELVEPADFIELIGFHESGHDGGRQMEVVAADTAWVTMETRYRGTPPRSAADIVVEPGMEIRSPVTGVVTGSGTYQLYCTYSDDFLWIEPDARPGWQVKVLHIDGVEVAAGDRVEAGVTRIAPRATVLPFESQIDELTAEPSRPHVHVEVVDLSIPDSGPPIVC